MSSEQHEMIVAEIVSRRGLVHGQTERGVSGGWTRCGQWTRDMKPSPAGRSYERRCKRCFPEETK